MNKEELLALGLDEGAAEEIMADREGLKNEYENKLSLLKKEKDIEILLLQSGAKNKRVVRALLEDGEDYSEQIEKLKKGEDTKFLFEGEKSFAPGRSAERIPNSQKGELEARLKRAREEKNTVEAIRIKQIASKKGIMLI